MSSSTSPSRFQFDAPRVPNPCLEQVLLGWHEAYVRMTHSRWADLLTISVTLHSDPTQVMLDLDSESSAHLCSVPGTSIVTTRHLNRTTENLQTFDVELHLPEANEWRLCQLQMAPRLARTLVDCALNASEETWPQQTELSLAERAIFTDLIELHCRSIADAWPGESPIRLICRTTTAKLQPAASKHGRQPSSSSPSRSPGATESEADSPSTIPFSQSPQASPATEQESRQPTPGRKWLPDEKLVRVRSLVTTPYGNETLDWLVPLECVQSLVAMQPGETTKYRTHLSEKQLPEAELQDRIQLLAECMLLSVRAILGEFELDLGELQSLTPGDVLLLRQPVTDAIPVTVAGQPLWTGRPVRIGQNLGVQIETI